MTPVVVRPRRLLVYCRVVAVLVVLAFVGLALALPKGQSESASFGVADQVAFVVLGLLVAAVPLGFTRVRVRADERGVWVRNVGERFLPWEVVVGVHLPESAPWALLELQDDETVGLLALQSNDRAHAVEGVLALRRLLKASQDGRHDRPEGPGAGQQG
ncbi:MAG: hypothetical protein JWM64_1948 [Frankiales bacterium]|nr:hypothetical protein [Frankiales bacterium]